MLADFFTKPLQGALFCKFCNVILGYRHINTLTEFVDTAAQERVGERPADDDSTSIKNKKNTFQGKQLSWADVVVGRNEKQHEKTNKPSQETILTKQFS